MPLTPDLLRQKVRGWLTKHEIEAVSARADLLGRFFDNEVARRGEAAVLYDPPRSAEPCGTGLR